MGLEAELFHMLIERLGAVEDNMQQVRADLEMILLPRLHDVNSGNINDVKDRLKEQDVVRALASRNKENYGRVLGTLPDIHVQQMKTQGFRVYQTRSRGPDSTPLTYILWGEQQLDDNLLSHVWNTPDDFVEL